jgi:hypothetical protein
VADDERFDFGEVSDPRIVQRRTRRTSEAASRLCFSWFRAAADIFVGGINVAGHVAEDMTDAYCERPHRRGDV